MGSEPTQPMQTYGWWDQVPEHLMTRKGLGKQGLKPGGPVAAKIEYVARRHERSYDLYDRNEALPKQATPAQLRALEQARVKQRTCTKCSKVVEKPSELGKRTGRCIECRVQAAEAKRTREVDGTITWARSMLATPGALILDSETTDLHGYLVEVGVITMDGTVVFESLVNPQARIDATHIHGIDHDMVWGAPTFDDLEPELRRLLHGRTVVVYNADYDTNVLEDEIRRICTPSDEALAWLIEQDWGKWGNTNIYLREWQGESRWLRVDDWELQKYRGLISDQAAWWSGRVDWQCAMLKYSCFVGEHHEYYRDYKYQALRGGHRAVGDCQATLAVLKRMAAEPLSTKRMHEVPE